MNLQISSKNFKGLYTSLIVPTDWSGKTYVYVHGGPGSHCGDFEAGLEHFRALTTKGTGWLVYDQRGCGRSDPTDVARLSHRGNLDDLTALLSSAKDIYEFPQMELCLYGHSYGARLVYDLLSTNPEIRTTAIISGRSLHPFDAMNTSVLIDMMILRNSDESAFKRALEVLQGHDSEPYEVAKNIRECFRSPEERQVARQQFYWADESAKSWWESTIKNLPLKDSDEIYFQVAGTYGNEAFNPGVFDPSLLRQRCLLIQGFFDVLMNGSANPRVQDCSRVIRFNGSAHYPHFEQPELFMKSIQAFSSEGESP